MRQAIVELKMDSVTITTSQILAPLSESADILQCIDKKNIDYLNIKDCANENACFIDIYRKNMLYLICFPLSVVSPELISEIKSVAVLQREICIQNDKLLMRIFNKEVLSVDLNECGTLSNDMAEQPGFRIVTVV